MENQLCDLLITTQAKTFAILVRDEKQKEKLRGEMSEWMSDLYADPQKRRLISFLDESGKIAQQIRSECIQAWVFVPPEKKPEEIPLPPFAARQLAFQERFIKFLEREAEGDAPRRESLEE